MPVPNEYQRATDDFYSFLLDARDMAGLWSTHVTYTMTQGVFQVFRKRLSIRQSIEFANILPVGLRALFVSDWNMDESKKEFQSREAMTQEVRNLRKEHNFSTDDAIGVIATVLRKHVDEKRLDKVLENFPEGSVEFWRAVEVK
jgi:uncharacterized protein (DUF2267 family)